MALQAMDIWVCPILMFCSSNEAGPLFTAQEVRYRQNLPNRNLDFPAKGAHQSPLEGFLYL